MGFFDSVPPRPAPAPPPPRPEWSGPPDLVVGGFVAARAVLADTDTVAIVVDRLLAYPTGLQFTVLVAWSDSIEVATDPFDWSHRTTAEVPPDILRFGVDFADGRRASTLMDRPRSPEVAPVHPVLSIHGGQGGLGRWERRFWLWPLPPPGPLGFVVAWPSAGVNETRIDLDGAAIAAAAKEALPLRRAGSSQGEGR